MAEPTPEMLPEAPAPGPREAPTAPLIAAGTSDRCVACRTVMSADQRYCVNCGERRGQARFALPASGAAPAGAAAPAEVLAVAASSPPRTPRASAGTTIVAGVGTLLLAMGVGVLIGRNSADSAPARTVQSSAPTVIHVNDGAGTGTTAASAGSAKSKKGGSKHTSKSAKTASANKPTAAQAAKASDAASKVLGASNKNLPPATVTVGQTGHGPGYNKTGHFDGSFFGQ